MHFPVFAEFASKSGRKKQSGQLEFLSSTEVTIDYQHAAQSLRSPISAFQLTYRTQNLLAERHPPKGNLRWSQKGLVKSRSTPHCPSSSALCATEILFRNYDKKKKLNNVFLAGSSS